MVLKNLRNVIYSIIIISNVYGIFVINIEAIYMCGTYVRIKGIL